MPRQNLCCTGLLPRRTLAVLCVAATAAAGVALGESDADAHAVAAEEREAVVDLTGEGV